MWILDERGEPVVTKERVFSDNGKTVTYNHYAYLKDGGVPINLKIWGDKTPRQEIFWDRVSRAMDGVVVWKTDRRPAPRQATTVVISDDGMAATTGTRAIDVG